MLMEEMQDQQDRMLAERSKNLELLEAGARPPPPKNLVSNLERIQKFINQLKVVQDTSTEALLQEVS